MGIACDSPTTWFQADLTRASILACDPCPKYAPNMVGGGLVVGLCAGRAQGGRGHHRPGDQVAGEGARQRWRPAATQVTARPLGSCQIA
eukprot:3140984-Prymnesium_polylepis.1